MFLIPLGTHSYVIPLLCLFECLGFLIIVYTFNQPLRHPTTRQHSRISSVNSERLAHLAIIKLYRQLPQQFIMSLKIVTYCAALGYIAIKIIKNWPNSRKNICTSRYYLVYLQQI